MLKVRSTTLAFPESRPAAAVTPARGPDATERARTRRAFATGMLAALAAAMWGCASDGSPHRDLADAARLDAARPGADDAALGRLLDAQADAAHASEDAGATADGSFIETTDGSVACSIGHVAFPTFSRTCLQDADCTFGIRSTDCCGSRLVTGIARTEYAAFNAAAQECDRQWPPCGCMSNRLQTDDGQTQQVQQNANLPVDIHCHSGTCQTSASVPGQTPCGSLVCDASQLCVHPSCGGGSAPPCLFMDDAGSCPAGFHFDTACPGHAGCRPDPCTPPDPYCAERPAACGGTASCACLPQNVCQGGGSCLNVIGEVVACGSA